MKCAQKMRKNDFMEQVCVVPAVNRGVKIRSQILHFAGILRPRYQRVTILLVAAGQRPRKVADVGSDAEVPDAATVDDDVTRHRAPPLARWNSGYGGGGELPGVERQPVRKRGNFAAHFGRNLVARNIFQHAGDELSHFAHLRLTKASSGDSRTAESHAARIERRIDVERDRV